MAYAFISPAMILFLIFTVLPAIFVVGPVLMLSDYQGAQPFDRLI